LGFGFQGVECGVQISGFRDSEFRVSGLGFRISGFGFRVSGFGCQVSGFGFRLLGFGFTSDDVDGEISYPPVNTDPPADEIVSNTCFRVSGSEFKSRVEG